MSTPTPQDLQEARERANNRLVQQELDAVVTERLAREQQEQAQREQDAERRAQAQQEARRQARELVPVLEDLEGQAQGILDSLATLLEAYSGVYRAYGNVHNQIRAHLSIFRGNAVVEQAALGLADHDTLRLLRLPDDPSQAHQLARQVLGNLMERHRLDGLTKHSELI